MNHVKRLLPAVSLVLLCIFFAFQVMQKTGRQSFLTIDNVFNLSSQYAYLLLMSMGATLVIIAGGIDLSVGSVLALSGVTAAHIMVKSGLPVGAGVLVGIAVGAACGTLTGLLTTRLKVPAFIASLGMLLVARGTALMLAKGVTVDGTPDQFNALASGRVLGLPVPFLLIVAAASLVAFLLHFTKFGRYVYAIGSNQEAARVSGIPVERVLIGVYAIGGALAGLAGLVETAKLASASPTGGDGYELDVITAVVVGGASLAGGEGRVSGTILGAALIAILHNGANLMGVDPYAQKIYNGILVIGAVAFDQKLRKLR